MMLKMVITMMIYDEDGDNDDDDDDDVMMINTFSRLPVTGTAFFYPPT